MNKKTHLSRNMLRLNWNWNLLTSRYFHIILYTLFKDALSHLMTLFKDALSHLMTLFKDALSHPLATVDPELKPFCLDAVCMSHV